MFEKRLVCVQCGVVCRV